MKFSEKLWGKGSPSLPSPPSPPIVAVGVSRQRNSQRDRKVAPRPPIAAQPILQGVGPSRWEAAPFYGADY